MLRTTGYLLWRLCRITLGFLLLGVGLFLSLPGIPGPGIVLILLSFGILSRDFHWAERAHGYIKKKWHDVRDRHLRTSATKETDNG